MKILACVACLFTFTFCFSQTYQESMDRCSKKFQDGLRAAFKLKQDTLYEKLNRDLRECIIGNRFPFFEATSLKNEFYSSADIASNVVLINLWFITCPPCVAEMPILNEIQEEYKGKTFKLLSFSTDDEKSIVDFIAKRKIKYPIFPHSKDLITKTFKLNFGYPTTVILNKRGEIVELKTGGPLEEVGLKHVKEEFKRIIDRELMK